VSEIKSDIVLSSDIKLQQTSHQDIDFGPDVFDHVTISKAEHEYLVSSTYHAADPVPPLSLHKSNISMSGSSHCIWPVR
jgi:hypothetical protein